MDDPRLIKALEKYARAAEVDVVAMLTPWLRHTEGCPVKSSCMCGLDAVIHGIVGDGRSDLDASIKSFEDAAKRAMNT